MYLKEVYIKNCRSIKECKVSLDDFTVFIGENNAGKTTILDAIRIGLNKAINRHSFDEYDFHMDENVNSPKESDGIKIIYHFEEKDFDASGVSGIIYRSNGSAGPFAKLAKVLSIPWVMLADNDEQGRQTVGEVRNCGYSEDVISSQVLLNSTTDFENELATSNRIFTDYESIVVEEITQDIIELKNSGDVDEYKKEIVKLVQKGKVVNAYKLLDLWSGNALSADDIPEVYVNAILGVCE